MSDKFPVTTLIFGTILAWVTGALTGALGTLAVFERNQIDHRSVTIEENLYYEKLDAYRKSYQELENELRKAELERLKRIAQHGYQKYLTKELATDIAQVDEDIRKAKAKASEEARAAELARQEAERIRRANAEKAATAAKQEAVKNHYPGMYLKCDDFGGNCVPAHVP